ncbi:MAG TPA: phosphodiester glycosidase family protein [Thermoanaerobaculia bacterium]|nr:phosphodiester glycosidase family protein [Thermoanaerobaculia bacterium]
MRDPVLKLLRAAAALSLALLVACAPASAPHVAAPPIASPTSAIPGVSIRTIERKEPVPLVAHLVTIDLMKAGPVVVASDPAPDGEGFVATTVRDLAAHHGLSLAVNASFFEVPGGRYPVAGERADVVGGLVLDGKRAGHSGTIGGLLDGAICFGAHTARVEKGFACDGARWGLATGPVLLWKGARTDTAFADAIFKSPRHPRTAAGVDADGRTLWLLVVDGRQPGTSEGATLDDLKDILKSAGATDAVNLDGGGSSTLVGKGPDGALKLLNVPVHEHTPGRERPVVTAVGVEDAE